MSAPADDSPFTKFCSRPASGIEPAPTMAFDERPIVSHPAYDFEAEAATVAAAAAAGGGAPAAHTAQLPPEERPIVSRATYDEDAPLRPLTNNNFGAEGGTDADPFSSNPSSCASRFGGYTVAALNFNAKRVPFSPFDEATDGKLGSVYTRLTETLLARGDWERRAALRNKATGEMKLPASYNVLLGTAQGKGVPWGRLGYGIWPPPLVNYNRGFDLLTRKGKMVATLEQAKEDNAGEWPSGMPEELTLGAAVRSEDKWELAPVGFVFHPSKGESNPREALRTAYAAGAAYAEASGAGAAGNRWILKPSEGAKGEGIFIETELSAIEEHLDKQEARAAEGEAVSSWVIQKYIHNPLLLRAGERKFDMRCWILVDADYNVHLYKHGVLRVASASYNPSDISDRFSHLTNHCIATEHPEYGKFEPTNELFYAAFDAELKERYPEHAAKAAATDAKGSVLEAVVLPQVRRHVVQTLLAARERLEGDGEYYRTYQLYGYDFLVDADLRVWLCEINASPAVADELLPSLVKSLIRTALDPCCPPDVELMGEEAKRAYDAEAAAAAERGDCFETLYRSPPKEA